MSYTIGFLFDLDGVLIDSEREYTRIWQRIDSVYPSGKTDFAQVIKGTTLDKILADNYPDPEVRAAVERMLYDEERRMVYDYCPHAEAFLERLDRDGLPHALVTSSNQYKMDRLYADLPRFRRHFRVVIDASRVSRSKPDPEGYLNAAASLGLAACRCAVFEDSVQGVMAGRSAGAYVVGIAGTVPADRLAPWSDRVVDGLDAVSVDEIIDILEGR